MHRFFGFRCQALLWWFGTNSCLMLHSFVQKAIRYRHRLKTIIQITVWLQIPIQMMCLYTRLTTWQCSSQVIMQLSVVLGGVLQACFSSTLYGTLFVIQLLQNSKHQFYSILHPYYINTAQRQESLTQRVYLTNINDTSGHVAF